MLKSLKIMFSSDLQEAKKSLDTLLSYIFKALPHLTQEEKYDIKLIYSELIFNAVIHGNKSDRYKNVLLTVEITTDGTIKSVISDEGCGFDYNKLFYKIAAKENFTESGRGMQLVNALCDTLDFNEQGNEIHFSKRMAVSNVQSNNSR